MESSNPSGQGRKDGLLARAALVCAGILAALAAGEVLVRVLGVLPIPLTPLPIPTYRLSQNPLLRYEFRPNYRSDDATCEWEHKGFVTNADGFRDREHLIEKPPGTFRIAVVGDSITAGNGIVNARDLFTARLESLLNQKPSSLRYEVFNMGVSGYHTLQEAEILRVRGLKYDPDLVLVALCVNDFYPDMDGQIYEMLVDRNPRMDLLRNIAGFNASFVAKSRLAFVVYHRLKQAFPNQGKPSWSLEAYKKDFLGDKSCYEAGLDMLDAMQKKHGFTVLICLIPSFARPFDKYRLQDLHAAALFFAETHPGIQAVDLMDDFKAINANAPVFGYDPIHPNIYGHEVLAEILFKKLLPYLPEPKVLENKKAA